MAVATPIYLDYNATTPCDARVLEAMLPYFTQKFGNAASTSHSFGWVADEAVSRARQQVAKLLNAQPEEIVFTSGATEADNLALKGVYEMYASKGNHIITCVTEHKAVLDSCAHIEKLGGNVTYLPVDNNGMIDLNSLEAAITSQTILIAIMYGNNETGVIHPVAEIGSIARRHNVLFFTDATQAAGKIPVDVQKDMIDILALSAHKIYGPKGVGALYVRRKDPRAKITPQIDGGGHERGMRSGTMNVPGIVGLGKACELCMLEMEDAANRLGRLRDNLESNLSQLEDVYINGAAAPRLPHVSNISFKYADGNGLMMSLNKAIAVSSGSACNSASFDSSYVLRAMGISNQLADGTLRFSLGRFTTEEEISATIEVVKKTILSLRAESPLLTTH